MQIRVLFFGLLRDLAGRTEDTLELPQGATVAEAFSHYTDENPALSQHGNSVAVARNQSFATWEDELQDGDELAFMPPVSGGASPSEAGIADADTGNFFALTRVGIDVSGMVRRLLRGEDGAVVEFLGVVRNNSKGRSTRFLEYECYEPMALKVMADLGRQIAARHSIGRIGIVHRLGRLEIGEASVAIVVTSPHRRAAFEAASEAIDRLKRVVPIWKKEHFDDGEIWVEGEWDESIPRPALAQTSS